MWTYNMVFNFPYNRMCRFEIMYSQTKQDICTTCSSKASALRWMMKDEGDSRKLKCSVSLGMLKGDEKLSDGGKIINH